MKTYIVDPLGMNSVWNRFLDTDRYECIADLTDGILGSFISGEAVLCFISKADTEAFLRTSSIRDEALDRVAFLEDIPDLAKAGFKTYARYSTLEDVPELELVNIEGQVSIRKVIVINPGKGLGAVKIVNLGGHVEGDSLVIEGSPQLTLGKDSRLVFGKRLFAGDGVSITLERKAQCIFGDRCSLAGGAQVYLRDGAEFSTGDECSFGRVSIQGFHSIVVGDGLLTAHEVEIRDGDGHDILGLPFPNEPKRIKIGNSVWLGGKTTILKGCEIGNRSVVGSGSIATKTFPDNSLIAGIPAGVIRRPIDWRVEYTYYQSLKEGKGSV